MSDYSNVYNEIATVNDEKYLVQDGPLLEDPMIRNVKDLLQPEKQAVQLMMGEDDKK